MFFNYYKYYEEIKNRCLLIAITWGFCFSTCYYYKEAILFTLVNFNSSFISTAIRPYFIFTNVVEILNVYLSLILFVSNQIGTLFFFYQAFMFLSLGLYKFELLKFKFALQIFVASWVLSIILLYSIVLPFSWNFFLSFQANSTSIQPFSFFFETKLVEYFYFFTNMYYICFLNCQFLGLLATTVTSLSKKQHQIKRIRKLFYLMFVVFSTIITPPDIISQICVSLTLVIMYEILLILNYIRFNMATN